MKVLVTFTGDPATNGTDRRDVTMLGIVFPLGQAVPLEATSPQAQMLVGKLRRNSHFLVENVEADPSPEPAEAPKSKGKKSDV